MTVLVQTGTRYYQNYHNNEYFSTDAAIFFVFQHQIKLIDQYIRTTRVRLKILIVIWETTLLRRLYSVVLYTDALYDDS